MMFDRLALRDAADRAITQHRAEYDRTVKERDLKVVHDQIAWVKLHKQTWIDACSVIKKKLNDGHVILSDDIPRDDRGYTALSYYGPTGYDSHGQRFTEVKPYVAPAELRGLVAILDCTNDERVSSSGLKELGFTNFKAAIRYLTPQQVTSR